MRFAITDIRESDWRSRRISPPWFRIRVRVRDRVRDLGGEILRERRKWHYKSWLTLWKSYCVCDSSFCKFSRVGSRCRETSEENNNNNKTCSSTTTRHVPFWIRCCRRFDLAPNYVSPFWLSPFGYRRLTCRRFDRVPISHTAVQKTQENLIT